eukprot:Pompholyxophrys_punicea_v1_NODE_592_length_1629_cov_1.628335.p2 type:complete len:140 gc:universal NODE_592_length_1629_cov_1.628335:1418-999(-)
MSPKLRVPLCHSVFLIIGLTQAKTNIILCLFPTQTLPTMQKKLKVSEPPSSNSLIMEKSVNLTSEQLEILKKIETGKSVFITGGAGTGKSFLLKQIIARIPSNDLAITASTWLAAEPICGTSLHHFVGFVISTLGTPHN